MTIPPYSPQLNPAEKIIATIKARMREFLIFKHIEFGDGQENR